MFEELYQQMSRAFIYVGVPKSYLPTQNHTQTPIGGSRVLGVDEEIQELSAMLVKRTAPVETHGSILGLGM